MPHIQCSHSKSLQLSLPPMQIAGKADSALDQRAAWQSASSASSHTALPSSGSIDKQRKRPVCSAMAHPCHVAWAKARSGPRGRGQHPPCHTTRKQGRACHVCMPATGPTTVLATTGLRLVNQMSGVGKRRQTTSRMARGSCHCPAGGNA